MISIRHFMFIFGPALTMIVTIIKRGRVQKRYLVSAKCTKYRKMSQYNFFALRECNGFFDGFAGKVRTIFGIHHIFYVPQSLGHIPLNVWTKLIVEQRLVSGKFFQSFSIGNTVLFNEKVTIHQPDSGLENLRVYTGYGGTFEGKRQKLANINIF